MVTNNEIASLINRCMTTASNTGASLQVDFPSTDSDPITYIKIFNEYGSISFSFDTEGRSAVFGALRFFVGKHRVYQRTINEMLDSFFLRTVKQRAAS